LIIEGERCVLGFQLFNEFIQIGMKPVDFSNDFFDGIPARPQVEDHPCVAENILNLLIILFGGLL
jgi:hypothetical protein